MATLRDCKMISLARGQYRAEILAEVGGGLASYYELGERGRFDYIRPMPLDVDVSEGVFQGGSYPLVPYSNRISQGRFSFEGQDYQLPAHKICLPHAIHGVAWERAFEVVFQSEEEIILSYVHEADEAWPWDFTLLSTYRLEEDGLFMGMEITNDTDAKQPVSLGFHPYFNRLEGTRLSFKADYLWQAYEDCLPKQKVTPSEGYDYEAGAELPAFQIDHIYQNFHGLGKVEWPEQARSLEVSSDESLKYLVLYTPVGRDYFCFEPVRNMTDGLNRGYEGDESLGMKILGPEEKLSTYMRLKPL